MVRTTGPWKGRWRAVGGGLVLLAALMLSGLPVAGTPHGAAAPTGGAAVHPAATASGPPAGLWPTYMQNSERTGDNAAEVTLAPGNVSGLRPLWSERTGGVIEDSPIVDGKVVYVSAWDGYEYAFNLTNGSLRWKTFIGQTTFSACSDNTARGTTSSAAVENGTVYVMGGNPYLYALNATNGSIEWKTSELVNYPSGGDYNWASPLLYNGSAYVGLSTACGSPGSQGMLLAINLSGNHSVTHTFAIVPSGQAGGSIWTTSAADPATGEIWVTTGDAGSATSGYSQSILALRANNLSLVGSWQMPTGGGDYDFGAGPTLFHDASGRALVGALNKNGVFYALNRSNVTTGGTWKPVWSDNISWYFNVSSGQWACGCSISPAAFDGTTLYVGGGFTRFPNGTEYAGSLRAIDPATGAYRWSAPARGIVRAGLAYADNLVVDAPALDDNLTGFVEVRSAANGSLLFSVATNRTVDGPPSIADGILLFGIGNLSLGGPGYLRAFALPLNGTRPTLAPTGTFGEYSYSVLPTGGVRPYAYRWSFGDGSGSASAAGTHIYPAPGTYQVVVNVTDATGAAGSGVATVRVSDSPITIGAFSASPPSLFLGNRTLLTVAESGGYGALSYRYSGLPPGCRPIDGPAFSCVPASPGAFRVSVRVADAYGGSANASLTLNVLPDPTSPPAILSFTAQPAIPVPGETTNLTVELSGGSAPFTYVYGGLPPGCGTADVDPLPCTPTATGNFTVRVTVSDAQFRSATATLSLPVVASTGPPPPTLIVRQFLASPAAPVAGTPLDLVVVATGGTPPLAYAYTGLPAGCASADTLDLTCVPTGTGTFTVRVAVSDATGDRATANLTVDVAAGSHGSSLVGPWDVAGIPPDLWLVLGAAVLAAGAAAVALGWRSRRRPRRPAAAPAPGRPPINRPRRSL